MELTAWLLPGIRIGQTTFTNNNSKYVCCYNVYHSKYWYTIVYHTNYWYVHEHLATGCKTQYPKQGTLIHTSGTGLSTVCLISSIHCVNISFVTVSSGNEFWNMVKQKNVITVSIHIYGAQMQIKCQIINLKSCSAQG